MAAATVNIPAIACPVGPMLNGWYKGERTGSGTIVWKARAAAAAGEIDYEASSSSSPRRRRRPAIATPWARRRP
jgi:dihydroxyacid dehydratase/phosphogluconate dehydratase